MHKNFTSYCIMAVIWKRNKKEEADRNPLHLFNRVAKYHLSNQAKKNRKVGKKILDDMGNENWRKFNKTLWGEIREFLNHPKKKLMFYPVHPKWKYEIVLGHKFKKK